jgi:hypothetical protein
VNIVEEGVAIVATAEGHDICQYGERRKLDDSVRCLFEGVLHLDLVVCA